MLLTSFLRLVVSITLPHLELGETGTECDLGARGRSPHGEEEAVLPHALPAAVPARGTQTSALQRRKPGVACFHAEGYRRATVLCSGALSPRLDAWNRSLVLLLNRGEPKGRKGGT